MDQHEFERVVEQAIDEIPADLWARVENVRIAVEDEAPGDPGLYGLFDGIPLTERSSWEPLEQPSSITVFRLPLLRDFGAQGATALRTQIRVTVLHELGHYFGLDEGRLDELGYA